MVQQKEPDLLRKWWKAPWLASNNRRMVYFEHKNLITRHWNTNGINVWGRIGAEGSQEDPMSDVRQKQILKM